MVKNILKQLYPLTKLYMAVVLLASSFIIPGWEYSYFMAIICGVIAFFFGRFKTYIKRMFFSLFWIITGIFLIQSIFIPDGEITMKLGFISVYGKGVIRAVNITSKITAFISVLTMLTLIVSAKDFTLALEKKGMNPKITFILLLTLQMIPEMKKQAVTIMDSQKSRGMETEGNLFIRIKAFLPIFVPLVLSAIAGTEERALTLEARGFSANVGRTRLYDIEESEYDRASKIFLIIFVVLCVIWRVMV